MMKKWLLMTVVAASATMVTVANAQDKAKEGANHLLEFLTLNKPVKAEFIQVVPDPSMEDYGKIIRKAAEKDPKWFAEHQKLAKPGLPLPYHEKLMTKEQYDAYLATWDKRKIVALKGKDDKPARMDVILTKESDGRYYINVANVPISLLGYDPKKNAFKSSLGELSFLEKVEPEKLSALRAWSGYEWKFEKKEALITTKENFAIGRTSNNKFGYLIYRLKQISKSGQVVTEKNYVLRFAPVKKAKK